MFPEEGYFYISEDELMRRSFEPRFTDEPLAFVFYSLIKERDLFQNFELNKAQNFYNKVDDKNGGIEILFSDHSSLALCAGKDSGALKIFHPISGIFYQFAFDYAVSFG